jgi:hypothetical protein
MKKLLFAPTMALASIGLVFVPLLAAQDSGQVPRTQQLTENDAYQSACAHKDAAAQQALVLEGFLIAYPQSTATKVVLERLIDCYNTLIDPDKVVSAASRLLLVDPTNQKAHFMIAWYKSQQCNPSVDAPGQSTDPEACDDAARTAENGLTIPQPAGMSDDEWKKITASAYPVYHSAIALNDLIVKKDYPGAIGELTTALVLYPNEAKSFGLIDTFRLAEAYTRAGDTQDAAKAVWFYARVWNYAPPHYKALIAPTLDYWYARCHGSSDGLSDIKALAKNSLFPPDGFRITAVPVADSTDANKK